VEIDVDNHAGELLPGSLAQVHFKTPSAGPALIVPAAALIFRKEGLRVGVVVNGNVAHLVPVVIGEDDGANVQIVTGLSLRRPGDPGPARLPHRRRKGPGGEPRQPNQCGRQMIMPSLPHVADKLREFANLLTRYHREAVANLLPLLIPGIEYISLPVSSP
jgi:hypothetical protein